MIGAILHVKIKSVKSKSLTLGSFFFPYWDSLEFLIYTVAETDVCGFHVSYLF